MMDDSGRCAIQITLADPGTGTEGQRIWLELDPADGSWDCSAEVEDRYLPTTCRG